MLIRLDIIPELNKRLAANIQTGRHAVLDEKHKGAPKDHYLARWVKWKRPRMGALEF